MNKLILMIGILFFTSCIQAEEKCHLGTRDIQGFKSCDVELRTYGAAMKFEKKNTRTRLSFCEYLNSKDFKVKIDKFSFYSNVGELNIAKIKKGTIECTHNGWAKYLTSELYFKEKYATPVMGFSNDLPIKNIKRKDFWFTSEKRYSRAKKIDGTEELFSPGLYFKPLEGEGLKKYEKKVKRLAHENRSFAPKYYKPHEYKGLKMYDERWFGAKYEYVKFENFTFVRSLKEHSINGMDESALLLFVFDSKDNIVHVKTPVGAQGTSVLFSPIYSFNLHGIKYHVIYVEGDNQDSDFSIYFEINGKGYYRELGTFL